MNILAKFILFMLPTFIFYTIITSVSFKDSKIYWDFNFEKVLCWSLLLGSFMWVMHYQENEQYDKVYEDALDEVLKDVKEQIDDLENKSSNS